MSHDCSMSSDSQTGYLRFVSQTKYFLLKDSKENVRLPYDPIKCHTERSQVHFCFKYFR